MKSNRLTKPRDDALVEIMFFGRDGEREYLWCAPLPDGTFEVRTPPAFIENVSIGAVIEAEWRANGSLAHARTVRRSDGVTLRFMSPGDDDARQVYMTRLLPYARELGVAIGPASFVGQKMVAFHVAKKDTRSDRLLEFLEQLVNEHTIKDWETGDAAHRSGRVGGELDGVNIRHEKPS